MSKSTINEPDRECCHGSRIVPLLVVVLRRLEPTVVVLLLTGYLGLGVLYSRVVKRPERKGFAACPHHEALAALPRRCVSLCGWECTRYEPLGMVVPSSATEDSDDEIEDEVAYEYGDDNEGDDMEEGRGGPWHAAVEIIKRGRFKSKSIHRVE